MEFEPRGPRRPAAWSFETRILLLALAVGLPGSSLALLLLWTGPFTSGTRWAATVFLLLFWWGLASSLHTRVIRPLQTLANLLSALSEGDFSLRARRLGKRDALGQVLEEVNAIGATLREQRLGAVEATALLHRVMEEVGVAIFAFDDRGLLRLVNRAGERLLAEPAERLLGRPAAALALADCLEGKAARTLTRTFPGGPGRWDLRRSQFREGGLPHRLLVIADLSRTLREEERQAWKRLIRVLGHELNNSLAPIRSMAGTLLTLLDREPQEGDWREDMQRGLGIIGDRSESLIRFMAAYSRLARLPPPHLAALEISTLVRRVAALETRLPVYVERGGEVVLQGDADQLEQLLINLVCNAADAALMHRGTGGAGGAGGGVGVGWRRDGGFLELRVEDEGPGLASLENLFVPFYTTKPTGSGIGLVLSRQIAEAHGGTLTLENRTPGPGCQALLRLPLAPGSVPS
ncbi:MAG TPA: ATP-binding protein [Thermoanaerobaculia bacterium]|nr:ATP-binding protein [Thermoanaerobaculia bacterium]